METLNELFFKFSNKTLIVILDKDNKPWFNASHIAGILQYKRPNDAIRQLVEKEYIKNFKDIISDYKTYHNAQPTSLFINESGIYALLLRSKKKAAIKFYKWTIEEVLPSIRNKGYYELEQKHKIEIDELNQRIKILENNQAKKHITKGKYIYIIKSADNKLIKLKITEIYKIGKTIKFNSRMNTINTSSKDNFIILYKAKIDDITAVENCLKGMLSKQLYRSNKEHYIITLYDAIKMIKLCIKLTKSKLISEDKCYKKFISKSSRLKNNIYESNINFIFDLDTNDEEQIGGNINNQQSSNNILYDYENINKLYKLNKIVFRQFY